MSLALLALTFLNTPADVALYGDAYYEPTYAAELLIGSYDLPERHGSEGTCRGVFTIRPDGTARYVSGAAVVEQKLSFEIDEEMIDWMHREVTASNGKPDCNGKLWAKHSRDSWAWDINSAMQLRLCVIDKEAPHSFTQVCPALLNRRKDV